MDTAPTPSTPPGALPSGSRPPGSLTPGSLTPASGPAGLPAWRGEDLEAIRSALAIPLQMAALRAIHEAMAAVEQIHPEAIPVAQQALDAIAAIDRQRAALSPEQLQAPIEVRRKATATGALPQDGSLPVKKADVIEFDTELLREETISRYGEGLSIEQALRRQRTSHGQALLLMLPPLASWSRDPSLNGSADRFTAALRRS